MPLNLTFGSLSSAISNLSDLESVAENPTNLKFIATSLFPQLDTFFTQSLADLPDGFTASIGYTSGTNTWTPGSGTFTFTLSGGVSGTLTVLKSGTLYSATTSFPTTMGDGLDTSDNSQNDTTAITVPAGQVYVKLALQFQLNGGISGFISSGIYGVNANVAAGTSILVEFSQLCTNGITLKDALTLAFQSFTLPLHPQTFEKLKGNANSYLHYVFNANLQVGFGASIAMPTFSYAANYQASISQVGGAIGVNAGFNPSVSAGVALNFAGNYTGAFETVVWVDDSGLGHLHLFRAKTQSNSVGLTANITATPGLSAQALVDSGAALAALTNSLNPILQAGLAKVFSTFGGQIDGWANDLNTKVAAWLAPINSFSCSLDASITATKDTFMLADYTIDLTRDYAAAWQEMIDCRFYDAMSLANSGVTLSAGSGLEQLYSRTGKMHINLFGKFDALTSDTFTTNASLIYAGNNVFHLSVDTGRQLITTINGSTKEIDLYFAAEVDLSNVDSPVDNVSLHLVLQAVNNRKFGAFVANVIRTLLPPTQENLQLAKAVTDLANLPNTTQMLHVEITPSAYALLNAADTSSASPDWSLDETNFNTFALACQHMQIAPYTNPPYSFSFYNENVTYGIFSAANEAATGGPTPNRRRLPLNYANTGGNALTVLKGYFPGVPIDSDSTFVPLSYLLQVTAGFMNFVEDLKGLATIPPEATSATWQNAVSGLQTIMKADTSVDFMPPAALAVAYLCGTHPQTVAAPLPNLPAGTSIAVKMTL